MRILHISRAMGGGGTEKIVYQLCRDNRVHEQVVMSCGGIYADKLERHGIRHIVIPDITRKTPLIIIKCLYRILYTVKKEKIDIIHSHHRMAAFYTRLVRMVVDVKHVYTAHSVFEDKKQLTKFSLEKCDIIAVGEGVKRNLIDVYKIDAGRIKVIYNSVLPLKTGILNDCISKLREESKIIIGSIGRITRLKGADIFFRAMKIVAAKRTDVVAVMIGEGEDKAELKELKLLLVRLGITDFIHFMGHQNNILDIISQLDFVVHASRLEGLPLTPIETFSQGKTIIASDISGNNEVIEDGRTGLLFENENSEQLAEKILLLVEDISLRETLEKNAFTIYQEKYSYSEFLKKYNKIYQLC